MSTITVWGMPQPVQLPGRQAGALVQRPGLVHPDVHRDARLGGGVNRGGGRAIFDAGQPAGVAVGQNVDRPSVLCPGDVLDQRQTVKTDPPAVVRLLFGDGPGDFQGLGPALGWSRRKQSAQNPVHGPGQVDGRGAGRLDAGRLGLEAVITDVAGRGARHVNPIGCGHADERGPAHHHLHDGVDHRVHAVQVHHHQPVGQLALVDDLDRLAVGIEPDGAGRMDWVGHGGFLMGEMF